LTDSARYSTVKDQLSNKRSWYNRMFKKLKKQPHLQN
jgi:hypothetical protein